MHWGDGWLIAPVNHWAPLAATTRMCFARIRPCQEAVAAGLEQANSYNFFQTQVKDMKSDATSVERLDKLV